MSSMDNVGMLMQFTLEFREGILGRKNIFIYITY